ncbi:hypothetical protein ACFP2V_21305 [Streptomyces incanus]|uniref:Uncharacterized protein n=1 Tax=Streptomyces incanus TaxID=887453 RepID=A0ABW0XWJ6_9ACTN
MTAPTDMLPTMAIAARRPPRPAVRGGPGGLARQGPDPPHPAAAAAVTTAVAAVGSLVVLGVVVSVPGLSHFFGSRPPGPAAWTIALASAAGSVLVPLAVRGAAGALGKVHLQHTCVQPAG